MLDTAGKIWGKIQEFMKRISDLEDDSDETKKEVSHLRKEIEILAKGMTHSEKIQAYQGKAMVDLEVRIKKLESEKRGLAISAGKAKAKAARAEARAKH